MIATLGPPLLESESTRTLVYVWEEKPRYISFWPKRLLSPHPGSQDAVEYGSAEQRALLIAYDASGNIVGHVERYIDTRSLEAECMSWFRARTK